VNLVRYTVRVVFIVLALVLATIGVLSVTRSTPVQTVIAPGVGHEPPWVGDSLFARSLELYTGTILSPGNRVEVLLNGNATYPRLWRDIQLAKHSVTVQMYYAIPGVMADSMCQYLVDRAKAGVTVDVLLDAFGAAALRKTDFVRRLRVAGARVAWLRPLRWYTLNRAATRSHVRAVVVDGRIGYTGGFGLADYWFGDGLHKNQWRETNVRFEGPAVAELQAAFIKGWAEGTGVLLTGPRFMPPITFQPVGTMMAGLMHMVPAVGSTNAERYLALSIAGARKRLYVTNSYFVPEQDFRSLLKAAARRGVDVRVLTVSKNTDVKTTWLAGRDYYEELLRSGVRIYEYEPTMMHAKTLVVDGVWSSIGSMNFDNRSLAFNDEANVVVLDTAFGTQMDSVFMRDLTHAKEISLSDFAQRAWPEKLVEWGAEKLWRVL
jgi:cardiolipin synthase A/B